MVPLWAGNPSAFAREPRFEQDRKGQVDIVSAQQNMLADGNPRDIGDTAHGGWTQLEQAEVRSAAADIDHQNVSRLRFAQFLPQRTRQAVLLKPAIECRLWLLEQPHCTWETSFVCRGQCQSLCGSIERGRYRDRDFLIVECVAMGREATVPGAPKIAQDEGSGLNRRDFLPGRQVL